MKLSVQNGSFAYKKERETLKNISFAVESGDMLAILGPNGAGKTTLLRCIMGFLKWNSGKSYLDGQEIGTIGQRELWQKIAYVPQAKSVSSSYTVFEMVLLGRASNIGMFEKPKAEDIALAKETLSLLHLEALAQKRCDALSGGELQMVLIARALAAKPQILILDEPESNLDFKNQLLVLQTLSELCAKGIACIFNTHYPAHALTRANKSLLLQKGGAFLFGDTVKVITSENIQSAFGVNAVIGEIETENAILKNVIPLSIAADEQSKLKQSDSDRAIAVVSIILSDFQMSAKVNDILHEYKEYSIGRMGMPYHECGLYIINITFDAPKNEVQTLFAKLSGLPGVSAKVTYAQGEF